MPTSPMVSNLVFIKTGKNLQIFADENKLTFTSLIDDLTFSSPFDFKDISNQIIQMICLDGYRISHSKTNYKTRNPKVTGVIVKNNCLALSDEIKTKLANTEGKTPDQIRGLQNYADRIAKA